MRIKQTEMQRTINKEVYFEGIGLHTGEKTEICFRPAKVDRGVVFILEDLPGQPEIPADLKYVSSTQRGVNLKKNGLEIKTVEHLLSTLSGVGIDNIEVWLRGKELPAADGSCRPFVRILKDVLALQDKDRIPIKPCQPLWVSTENSQIVLLPEDRFKITYTIFHDHPQVKAQFASLVINEQTFEQEIAPARTYGFLNEVNALWEQGLAKGGSLENALVIADNGYLNEKLRFENELVRHKILDLIGDLALLGRPVLGHVIAVRSSHSLNLELAAKIREA